MERTCTLTIGISLFSFLLRLPVPQGGAHMKEGGREGGRFFQTSSSPGSSRSKPWELCNLGGKLLSSPMNAKGPPAGRVTAGELLR